MYAYNNFEWIYSSATLGLLCTYCICGTCVCRFISVQVVYWWKYTYSHIFSIMYKWLWGYRNVKNWEAFELFINEKVFNGNTPTHTLIHSWCAGTRFQNLTLISLFQADFPLLNAMHATWQQKIQNSINQCQKGTAKRLIN